jgi:hypothetical protein
MHTNSVTPTSGFISPLDLVSIGTMSDGEAKELHEMEASAKAGFRRARLPTALLMTRGMFGGYA